MLRQEFYEYSVQLSKLNRQRSFLFWIGLIMTVLLNYSLVMTLIQSRYDFSLIILVMFVVHNIFHNRAMDGVLENMKAVSEELMKLMSDNSERSDNNVCERRKRD